MNFLTQPNTLIAISTIIFLAIVILARGNISNIFFWSFIAVMFAVILFLLVKCLFAVIGIFKGEGLDADDYLWFGLVAALLVATITDPKRRN